MRGVGYRGPSSSLHMRPTGCAGPPADRSRIKDQCHPFFSKAPRDVSHAFCLYQHRPIPRHLAEMSGRPSATSIALAIRSCVSRHVGPLARRDVPPTGRAGLMFGPAGRPTESHVSSGREQSSRQPSAPLECHADLRFSTLGLHSEEGGVTRSLSRLGRFSV